MTNPNESIHPDTKENPQFNHQHFGLTKREYFAAMAMQGLLANPKHRKEYKGQTYLMQSVVYGDQSVKLADALVEALNKTK